MRSFDVWVDRDAIWPPGEVPRPDATVEARSPWEAAAAVADLDLDQSRLCFIVRDDARYHLVRLGVHTEWTPDEIDSYDAPAFLAWVRGQITCPSEYKP